MSKILLVYDDFAELNATELSLKKCSFDVIGLTNEYTIKDQIISFNPDILVGFGNTQRVSSLSVGKKIKEMTRWTGKSILLFQKGFEIPAEDLLLMRMDLLLETPVSVIRLIQIIAKLLKLDEKAIIEKLAKSFAMDKHNNMAFASYDPDTMKAIRHIQGELENLDSGNGESLADEIVGASGNTVEEEKPTSAKKSFFEKEDEGARPVESGDPFAALISELKGEPVGEPAAAATKPAVKAEDESIDYDFVGQQIQKEIADHAGSLNEKVKKYAQFTAELHLYPESTVKKTKAKRQLNELKKGWDPKDLQAQDQSRREFVERLFNAQKKKS